MRPVGQSVNPSNLLSACSCCRRTFCHESSTVAAVDGCAAAAGFETRALQARHLFDRGHRRLSYAHLKDRRQNLYGQPRYEGFRTTCDQLGLPEPDIIELAIDSEEATAHLRKLGRSTAIACYNDDVALTLLSAGQHLEIAVPADLALIGVDNTALGRAAFPRLTTIGYDTDEIARMLTHRVLSTVGVSVPSPPAPPRLEIIQGGTS